MPLYKIARDDNQRKRAVEQSVEAKLDEEFERRFRHYSTNPASD